MLHWQHPKFRDFNIVVRPFRVVRGPQGTRLKPRTTWRHYGANKKGGDSKSPPLGIRDQVSVITLDEF